MNKLHIPPLDEQAAKAALEHQKILAKPPLALGKLEPVAIRIAAMTGNPAPRLKDKAIVLFAADHHIADHGLSLTSTDVTYIQTRNFLQGGGTINAFTRNAGARLSVVDVGVNYDFGDLPGLVKRKVMHGANDFSRGPAMTREQALECLQVGIDMAREEKNKGLDIVAAGEMGIGNTTPSSAIVAVLTGTPCGNRDGTRFRRQRRSHPQKNKTHRTGNRPEQARPFRYHRRAGEGGRTGNRSHGRTDAGGGLPARSHRH